MTPVDFIGLWKGHEFNEREGAQLHFSHLCRLLGVDEPIKKGEYQFERGAEKSSGGNGWADVWKRGHFAWENKKPGRNLKDALKQLTDYSLQLESPPLLVVCDRERIVIHKAFTGYPDEPETILIEELASEATRQRLRWVWTDPAKLRPEKSSAAITAEAAKRFAELAEAMRQRGEDHDQVAHFLVQCLFCMFAEDEELLPKGIFTSLLTNAGADVDKAARRIETLFKAMGEPRGEYGDHDIAWFNGGLFKSIAPPTLAASDLDTLRSAAADMDWRAIDPTIFGTLFERGLGEQRAPLGAHYTDTGTIAKLVDPLVREPLLAEWEAARLQIAELAPKFGMVKGRGKSYRANEALRKGEDLYRAFLLRLNHFRVLDPACGSGNFLYLALKAMRDVEKKAHVDAQELGLHGEVAMQTGPHNILGLEINEFAAELARVTVWIGDIQWCRQNGWQHSINPILKPLDGIENRDALLNEDGSEARWPKADVIVGNPPFLGDKKMQGELGAPYTKLVRKVYDGRVPGGADLVCFWLEKARGQIEAGEVQAAGLVSTNSIRGGANRRVLQRILETTRIFLAWSDEEWWDDGAAVRVSMTGFGNRAGAVLNGKAVGEIYADLTAGGEGIADITKAKRLPQNLGVSFQGVTPSASLQRKRREELGLPEASFNLTGDMARSLLSEPANLRGEPMADVVRPYWIADDVTSRPLDRFIVNFGTRDEISSAVFEKPFAAIVNVRLHRAHARRNTNYPWWLLLWPRPQMFAALSKLSRFIAIPRVSKHHLCVWAPASVAPGDALVVIARDDDTTLGIIQSRIHRVWALRQGTNLGVGNDPRYTHTTSFETFPFPEGMTPDVPAAAYARSLSAQRIGEAMKSLTEARNAWLNPQEWVEWVRTPEEELAGFPGRPALKPDKLEKAPELKKRTLTNLYNGQPNWLRLLHEALDKNVAEAYGWADYTPGMADQEILRRLLALNHVRAGQG